MDKLTISGTQADDVIISAEEAGVKITHGLLDTYLTGDAGALMRFCALLATCNGGDNTDLVALLSARLSVSLVVCGDVPGNTRWTFSGTIVNVD